MPGRRLYLSELQQQRIAHNADAAHGHGCSGNHGIQKKSVNWIKYAGSNRNCYHIVNEGPEEVHLYGPDSFLG